MAHTCEKSVVMPILTCFAAPLGKGIVVPLCLTYPEGNLQASSRCVLSCENRHTAQPLFVYFLGPEKLPRVFPSKGLRIGILMNPSSTN